MPKVIGYGEDALTYWALTRKLDFILKELGDGSKHDDCLIFYRPSFGRGRTVRKSPGLNAEFGEFDAILTTTKAVYLIESKWDNLSEREAVVELSDVQVLRHKIFAWYYGNWKTGSNWKKFVESHERSFNDEFGGWRKKIAPPDSLLGKNLKYVLDRIHDASKEVKNVLFYFYRKGSEHGKVKVKSGDLLFQPLPIEYLTLENSNYTEIT